MSRWSWLAVGVVCAVVVAGVMLSGQSAAGEGGGEAVFVFDAPPGNSVLWYAGLYTGNVSVPDGIGIEGRETSAEVVERFNTVDRPVMAEVEFNYIDRIDRPFRVLNLRQGDDLRETFVVVREGSNVSEPGQLEGKDIALAEERIYGWFARFLLEEEYNVTVPDERVYDADSIFARRLLALGVVDAAQTFFFYTGHVNYREVLRARSVFNESFGAVPPARVFVVSEDMSRDRCRGMVSMINRSVGFGRDNAVSILSQASRRQGMLLGSNSTVDYLQERGHSGLKQVSTTQRSILERLASFMVSKGYWSGRLDMGAVFVGNETGSGCSMLSSQRQGG